MPRKNAASPQRVTAARRTKPAASSDAQDAGAVPALDLHDASLYINRELSLLAFQRRVLEEAADAGNPLLERVKFLSILGSNLEEFFMVRVAGLLAQVDAGTVEVGPDRMSPRAQLVAIRREVKKLLAEAHTCLRDDVLPALADEGIEILEYSSLTPKQLATVNRYFEGTVFPVLTPLAFDPGRPFPHISNLSLNLAVLIRDPRGTDRFARVKVPDSLPALISVRELGRSNGRHGRSPKRASFVWLEQVIAANLQSLFPGMTVLEAHPFHVTRDADIAIKELEAEDLLESIEEGVRQRRFGDVVRLSVTDEMPDHILDILQSNLELERSAVYRFHGPLSLKRLMPLYDLARPELKDPPVVPNIPKTMIPTAEDEDVFALMRRSDILLHHPFDSFQPVVDFLRKAAHDPHVLAIKTVLYRVGRNSPVVNALLEAMENGKQVAVLVELKARFDEESNIEWARALEREGVHVVYGLLGLKIHCKVAMVVRREGHSIQRYVHLATGNYNAVTAHTYTDIGLFTCDERIAEDVSDLFNYLTGYSAKSDYNDLFVAPVNLRARFEALIEREIEHHKRGEAGLLIFKMNSLTDEFIIRALYRASQAGVKVQLLVRGSCCLRPGIPEISHNIEVTSIVGRFLEHSRIYYFRNGGEEEVYLGSADLMPRNLNRRVEVLFPLKDPALIRRVRDRILTAYLADTAKARRMHSDGSYTRERHRSKPAVSSQTVLLMKSLNAGAAAEG
ncbi:MAG: polyphosphate kinase 1 [Bryobacteraceae bacterium]